MQSLRIYLENYAAGGVDRQEMLKRVAAWPLEETLHNPAHTLPTHQDNTADVLAAAVVNGQISEEDSRRVLRTPTAGTITTEPGRWSGCGCTGRSWTRRRLPARDFPAAARQCS
ncbi:hypothetical protein PL81_33425 [Streptomyces sp. RSD-27]|nr:hypothetical protein PL81_33425 [Streptomyces sp. RSD-27]